MKPYDRSIRSIFTVGMLSVLVGSISWSQEASSNGSILVAHTSEKGAIEVAVPNSWHSKELSNAKVYQLFLSREKVDKQGDAYQYGLYILRVKDYKDYVKSTAKERGQIVLDHVTSFASTLGEHPIVINMLTGDHGIKMFLFKVSVDAGTDKALTSFLLVGLDDGQWVQALWEIPTRELQANEAAIKEMINSFKVNGKYKG